MKKIIVFSMIALLASFTAAAAAAGKPKPIEKMTKEEVVKSIKAVIDAEEGVLDTFPAVKKEKAADGTVSYTYQGVKLEGLQRDMLVKLLGRIRGEAVRIRTERIGRQLAAIKQAENITHLAGGSPGRIQSAPPGIPRIPPSVPQVPKVPPAPPRR